MKILKNVSKSYNLTQKLIIKNEDEFFLQREKLVHKEVMDYMGKQNLLLREEVLNLSTNHANDTQCMDWAIEKIQNEIKMKKMQIADIEPG